MTEDRKEYSFKCGITAAQEECNIEQDKKLVAILSTLDLKTAADFQDMKIADLVALLVQQETIERVLDVILIHVNCPEGLDWSQLKRSELAEVIDDFFTLSPVLKRWFGTGNFAQVLKSALQ